MEIRYQEEMIRTIGSLMAADQLGNRHVLAFGHCHATEVMIDHLLDRGVRVNGILDNNRSKQGSAYQGIPIVPPQAVRRLAGEEAIVLIATRYYEPMVAQLRELGFAGDIVKVVDYNTFAEYSVSDDAIRRKTERMLRGTDILKAIREQYRQHHLVVCPHDALGDVYAACSYLPAYSARQEIGETVVAVVGHGCRQVAEMFGMDRVVVLDPVQMDELVQAIIFHHEDNCLIAHHDRPYTDNLIRYLDRHFMSFTDYYKYAVYGLGKDAEPVRPSRIAPFDNRANLARGRSVIIAPYAKSVVQPPRSFWDELVKGYRQQGFQVYTNVVGDEAPLPGTIPLTLPINQMIRAVEYAGHFVGLRSGLCDIVSTADCRKTVIMPDCIYSTTRFKVADFFALPGWEQIII